MFSFGRRLDPYGQIFCQPRWKGCDDGGLKVQEVSYTRVSNQARVTRYYVGAFKRFEEQDPSGIEGKRLSVCSLDITSELSHEQSQ